MSDPFLDDKSGVESSRPREFYEIVQSTNVTYRIASGARDISYGGNTFTAYPAARTDLVLSTTTGEVQLTLSLPLSHGLAQRWMAMSSPPRQVRVIIRQLETTSGLVETLFDGLVMSMAFDKNHLAKFVLSSTAERQWKRTIGRLVSTTCGHFLYDANCKIDRNSFKKVTTVANVDGRRVFLTDASPLNVDQLILGELFHSVSGERQTIYAQLGSVVDMQAPIPGMAIGDSVTVFAGCAHDVTTCRDKFANVLNFGGFPHLPDHDFFVHGSRLGILGVP